ncbi:hypothetical protein ACNF40_00395 [Cuniculiplasma sp. SKW4]|uniref:hypothetical protein n=1 Tax=Cuniculiplasma sp. SKW4 TaxID=3400171 RepID=UPI003FD1356C
MSELKDAKRDMFLYCESKFTIFESDHSLEEVSTICLYFKSKDWKKFIDIADTTNSKLLYYYEDNHNDEHPNEIGMIQLGFIQNGVMHIYSQSADWYIKLEINGDEEEEEEYFNESSPTVDKRKILQIMKSTPQELLNEILNFLKETGRDFPFYVDSLLDDYFSYRYNFRYSYIKNNLNFFKSIKLNLNEVKQFKDKMDEVLKLLNENRLEQQKKRLERDLERDEETLKTAIPECVEWAKVNSLPKLNKSNIYDFCILKNYKLSDTGMDRLYIIVNKELKKNKTKS